VLEERTFSTKLGDHTITLSTGKIARLAGGAVIAQSGDTVLLATATMAHTPREGTDFFPLTCDFEERLYAVGRIPGSFFRREGRPSEQGILTSRLIDRPLRPLFPKDLHNDVQVIVTSLSQGEENYADILGVIAASAALTISDIPFEGPVGAVRIGYIDGALVVNPTISQMKNSDLDLRVAGSVDAIIMVEAGANEVEEELMVEAMQLAHQSIQDVIELQNEMRAAVGKPKKDYPSFKLPEALKARVAALVTEDIQNLLATSRGRRLDCGTDR
jgi:polyribonucleotide nucleotidyltransferase